MSILFLENCDSFGSYVRRKHEGIESGKIENDFDQAYHEFLHGKKANKSMSIARAIDECKCENTKFILECLIISGAKPDQVAQAMGLEKNTVATYHYLFYNTDGLIKSHMMSLVEETEPDEEKEKVKRMCIMFGPLFSMWYLCNFDVEEEVIFNRMQSLLSKEFFNIGILGSDSKNSKKLIDLFHVISSSRSEESVSDATTRLVNIVEEKWLETDGCTIEHDELISAEELQEKYIGKMSEE